jgi:hypothetical protein
MDEKSEWSPVYSRSLKEIIKNKNNFIDISVKAFLPEEYDDIVLVASLESKGNNIYWDGMPFDRFVQKDLLADRPWVTIHHSIKLSDIYLNYPDIQLKIYVWNKGRHNFLLDDFTILLRSGNPLIYGLEKNL